jgi:hypothetical protein
MYFDLDLNKAHDKIEHIVKLIELHILRERTYLGISQLGALANSLDLILVVYVADKSDASKRVVLNMSAVQCFGWVLRRPQYQYYIIQQRE